jgi:ketosteroid isomerase-like protein
MRRIGVTVPARTPEESSSLISMAIGAGDLDAILALYESDAVSVPPTGEGTVSGGARRAMFEGMVALNPTLDFRVSRTLTSGDIALVTGSWTMKGTAPDGSPLEMEGAYVDVLRRQNDGTWKFIIDNPLGTN